MLRCTSLTISEEKEVIKNAYWMFCRRWSIVIQNLFPCLNHRQRINKKTFSSCKFDSIHVSAHRVILHLKKESYNRSNARSTRFASEKKIEYRGHTQYITSAHVFHTKSPTTSKTQHLCMRYSEADKINYNFNSPNNGNTLRDIGHPVQALFLLVCWKHGEARERTEKVQWIPTGTGCSSHTVCWSLPLLAAGRLLNRSDPIRSQILVLNSARRKKQQ